MPRKHADHAVRVRDEIYNALFRKMHKEGFIGSVNLYVESILWGFARRSDITLTAPPKKQRKNEGRAGQVGAGRRRRSRIDRLKARRAPPQTLLDVRLSSGPADLVRRQQARGL